MGTSNVNMAVELAPLNITDLQNSPFTLLGIPGLEYAHIWISIPICITYISAFVGNIIIILIIATEESLHHPMFLLLCMLAGTDLILINSVVPKALGIFWLNSTDINLNSCLMQMYICHAFTASESGVLAIMALDRYIAICYPLRYGTILTNQRTVLLGAVYFAKGALLFAPYPYLVKRLAFCKSTVIAHTYCEHMSVARLSCTDFTVNVIYGLCVSLFISAEDLSLICFSYFMILRTVSRLSAGGEGQKALGTCISHVCVIVVFYVPILATVFIQRFTHEDQPYLHIIVANLYFLVPPMVNPLVYGVRVKQIRVKVLKLMNCQ